MGLSPMHLIILGIVVVLLFGGGRFSSMMVDVAKGVKDFKKSMAEGDEADVRSTARLTASGSEPLLDHAAKSDRSPT